MIRLLVWLFLYLPSLIFGFASIGLFSEGDIGASILGLFVALLIYSIGKRIIDRFGDGPVSQRYYDEDYQQRNPFVRLLIHSVRLALWLIIAIITVFGALAGINDLINGHVGSAIILFLIALVSFYLGRFTLKLLGDSLYRNASPEVGDKKDIRPTEKKSFLWYLITTLSVVGLIGTPIEMLAFAQHFIVIGDFWLGIVGLWDLIIGHRVDQALTWIAQQSGILDLLGITEIPAPVTSWCSLGVLTANIYARSIYIAVAMHPSRTLWSDGFTIWYRLMTFPATVLFWPVVIIRSIVRLRQILRRVKPSKTAEDLLNEPLFEEDDRREQVEEMAADMRSFERAETAQELFVVLPFSVGLILLAVNLIGGVFS